jgi:polysaccharide biosynthesis protein PslH
MRLLVVSSWLPFPMDNGSRIRASQLLKRLSRSHTITLLSFGSRTGTGDLGPLRDWCDRVEVVPPVALGDGRLGPRGLVSRLPRHLVQCDNPQMHALIREAIGDHDAAVALQVEAARYLEDYSQVPRVFEEVEVAVLREHYERESHPLRRLRRGLTWWKYRRYVQSLVNAFDRATVVSEQERRHLRDIGCEIDRVAVVPNGVEIPNRTRGTVDADRLIYPGSVTYFANLDALRYFIGDILPTVRQRRPNVELLVTGSTDGVDVGDLRAASGVTFTGLLPQVDTAIAESAVCVVPLRVGGGTRLKVLQAMALGTPVVATSKGIEGLEVEPERHVLVGETPDTFARQVLRVLSDPNLAGRLAHAAHALVRQQYAWGPIGDGLDRVIGEAVAAHRTRKTRQRHELS